jgi:hypothetical protein
MRAEKARRGLSPIRRKPRAKWTSAAVAPGPSDPRGKAVLQYRPFRSRVFSDRRPEPATHLPQRPTHPWCGSAVVHGVTGH